MTIVNKMRDAIEKMGAPADLVQTMAQPSIGKTEELMRQCDRILATGGPGMVTAAYSSGTPALGVGAGNAVITVDDTLISSIPPRRFASPKHSTSPHPALPITRSLSRERL